MGGYFLRVTLPGQLVTFYRPAKGRKHLTVQKRPAKSKQSRQQAKRGKESWLLWWCHRPWKHTRRFVWWAVIEPGCKLRKVFATARAHVMGWI